MAQPTSLLQDVRGFARDFPRDRMPEGLLWDMADFIPALLDAQLTGRGGWRWGSAVLPAKIDGGLHATFKSGDRLLVVAGTNIYQVSMVDGSISPTPLALPGTIVQNPVLLGDQVIVAHTGQAVPKVVTATASAMNIANAGAGAPTGKYSTVYKGRVLVSGGTGNEEKIYFSPPRDALVAWDATRSWEGTSLPLTGLGALRGMILAFHAGSVERLRGSEPAHEGNPEGDMNLENLFDRAGCGDAKSIAYWNDNCIFADERGVHLTDGAIVKNMISQGGLVSFWRTLFLNRISIAAETYLDYYVVTIIRSDGVSITLICDLQRRSWFRFSNIKSNAYIRSYGTQEQLWGGRTPDNRLMQLADCFFPIRGAALIADADATPVLPVVETGWNRLGEEGRKRIRFLYTSYDIRTTPITAPAKYDVPVEGLAEAVNGEAKAALAQLLEVSYALSPFASPSQFIVAGVLPETSDYDRFRLPVNRQPYGISVKFRQTAPSTVTRIAEFGVEAQATERSRL